MGTDGWKVIVGCGTASLAAAAFAATRVLRHYRTSQMILNTPLSSVEDLRDLQLRHDSELGTGPYVKLKGTVNCPRPVVSPLSGIPCAMSRVNCVRHYEEKKIVKSKIKRKSKKDKKSSADGETSTTIEGGTEQAVWTKKEEAMSTECQESEFFLDDGTGIVRVVADNAPMFELDCVKDEFLPYDARSEQHSERRTIGYAKREYILGLDKGLFVLGEVVDDANDGLAIQPPSSLGMFERKAKKNPYLLTTMSESKLVHKIEGEGRVLAVLSALLAAASVGLFVWGTLEYCKLPPPPMYAAPSGSSSYGYGAPSAPPYQY